MEKILKLIRRKRIMFVFGMICFLIFLLCVKLVYIQGYKSIEYSSKQSNMLLQRLPITASRGDIYDRNMNLLAKDATSSSVYIRPIDVNQKKGKEIATYLSSVLGLKYEDIYSKITKKEPVSYLLKRKVDNSVVLDIKKKNYKGVELSEDKKRYYTNGNFASYVLGFTGSDHQGLYGVEASYESILKGVDGVTIYETDGKNRKIASGTQIRQEPKNGDNLVLTIDSVIQIYAEKALEEGVKRTKSKRGMAIVMDPNTGEILGMAAYPSYDLNDPWAINEEFKKVFDKTTDTSKKQFAMWENPLVSYIYEPGSTFKLVTASAALEEGSVVNETKFYCSGSKTIYGTTIRCHIYPKAHGSENLADALKNSCNPAMIETSMRMGPDLFYKYMYNYGFGAKTGIDLNGEENGILTPNQNISIIDFVTKSFGQGIAVTPIQMITASCAVVNGGYLLKPQVVNTVTNSDNTKIVTPYKKEVVRQVISKNTSDIMKQDLRGVVLNSASLKPYKNETVKMGGKTGTAQKIINGQYAKNRYVTSFFGFAPYDNPKVSVLVLLDEPLYNTSGSSSAAPIVYSIIKNATAYLNTKGSTNKADVQVKPRVIVPDLRGYELRDAMSILEALNIDYEVKFSSKDINDGIIVSQSQIQTEYNKKITINVSQNKNDNEVIVPNLVGMSVQGANEILTKNGLKIEVEGGGIAYEQNISGGTSVKKGTIIKVKFKYVN